jgi:hypothetical protein
MDECIRPPEGRSGLRHDIAALAVPLEILGSKSRLRRSRPTLGRPMGGGAQLAQRCLGYGRVWPGQGCPCPIAL